MKYIFSIFLLLTACSMTLKQEEISSIQESRESSISYPEYIQDMIIYIQSKTPETECLHDVFSDIVENVIHTKKIDWKITKDLDNILACHLYCFLGKVQQKKIKNVVENIQFEHNLATHYTVTPISHIVSVIQMPIKVILYDPLLKKILWTHDKMICYETQDNIENIIHNPEFQYYIQQIIDKIL